MLGRLTGSPGRKTVQCASTIEDSLVRRMNEREASHSQERHCGGQLDLEHIREAINRDEAREREQERRHNERRPKTPDGGPSQVERRHRNERRTPGDARQM